MIFRFPFSLITFVSFRVTGGEKIVFASISCINNFIFSAYPNTYRSPNFEMLIIPFLIAIKFPLGVSIFKIKIVKGNAMFL